MILLFQIKIKRLFDVKNTLTENDEYESLDRLYQSKVTHDLDLI
jgi:hypothetical protein